MRFLFYTHSLVSDWNHGNAHFLRGIMRDLLARGHDVAALEPQDGWSRGNLLAEQGEGAIDRFRVDFPELTSVTYDAEFEHENWLAQVDVVIVHEWTDPELVARIGRTRALGGDFTLLFHDTHHRAVSAGQAIAALRLEAFDGVLAFGEALSERYRRAGWGRRVYTWHEAADVSLFGPRPEIPRSRDMVWIGNWGDDERSAEIGTFLVEPVRALGLTATVHGVRYPEAALRTLSGAGIDYRGWIANADVPAAFARHQATVHIPRRPYVDALPGIPTIRMFEALACGIPLVSAPWSDAEGLFHTGRDFLRARDGAEMTQHLSDILHDPVLAASLSQSGQETVHARHTCGHRVGQLFDILADCGSARVAAQLSKREAA
jgi:spore maturation protein CgeB